MVMHFPLDALARRVRDPGPTLYQPQHTREHTMARNDGSAYDAVRGVARAIVDGCVESILDGITD